MFLKGTTEKTVNQKGRFPSSLIRTALPLLNNILIPLVKNVLLPLEVTAAASVIDAAIESLTTLIILNEEIKDI